eukprot:scaffold3291_cov109-Isochrysis_galbana.AAC.5
MARGDLRFPALVGLVTDARCVRCRSRRESAVSCNCARVACGRVFLFAFYTLCRLCAKQKNVKSSSCVHTRYTCARTPRDATTQATQRVGRRHRRTESRSSVQCPDVRMHTIHQMPDVHNAAVAGCWALRRAYNATYPVPEISRASHIPRTRDQHGDMAGLNKATPSFGSDVHHMLVSSQAGELLECYRAEFWHAHMLPHQPSRCVDFDLPYVRVTAILVICKHGHLHKMRAQVPAITGRFGRLFFGRHDRVPSTRLRQLLHVNLLQVVKRGARAYRNLGRSVRLVQLVIGVNGDVVNDHLAVELNVNQVRLRPVRSAW